MKTTTLLLITLFSLGNAVAQAGGGLECQPAKKQAASSSKQIRYVAHEWGTFTSVQGADGIPLAWRPLITTDLPEFVYDSQRVNRFAPEETTRVAILKGAVAALQRMETPVIYFYADQELKVSAEVKFPKGLITEWYPAALLPTAANVENLFQVRDGSLSWPAVKILPAKQHRELAALLPSPKMPNHYFAARTPQASFVQAPGPEGQTETENFLFYRGVGSFQAPLRFSVDPQDQLRLANQDRDGLSDLFILELRQGQGRFLRIPSLRPGETRTLSLSAAEKRPAGQVQSELERALQQALTQSGLYDGEAEAMVRTWKDSWLGEEGLRVLYLLPRTWTDRILPLDLKPAPSDLVRVMVGRAEMIEPSIEHALESLIVQQSKIRNPTEAVVAANHLGLGRFLEPAVRRLQRKHDNKEFTESGNQLLEAVGKSNSTRVQVAKISS